jgi:hypothetical protein
MTDLILRAHAAPWRNAVELQIVTADRKSRVTQLTLTDDIDPGAILEPTLKLSLDAAQTLMDDLWNAGIRPTEGAGSAGAMRAVERHLEDMRTLVFNTHAIPT